MPTHPHPNALTARHVFNYSALSVQLTAPPVNTAVLAFLSSVAGDALTRHLGVILPALLSSLKGKLGTEDEAQVRPPYPPHPHSLGLRCRLLDPPTPSVLHQELCSCQTVVLSVEDEVGQRIIIEDLLEATRSSNDPGLRQAAVTILNAYFARTRLDYSAHVRTLLSGLIRLLNDSNPDVLVQSWDAISSITKVCVCARAHVAVVCKKSATQLLDAPQ